MKTLTPCARPHREAPAAVRAATPEADRRLRVVGLHQVHNITGFSVLLLQHYFGSLLPPLNSFQAHNFYFYLFFSKLMEYVIVINTIPFYVQPSGKQ